MKFIATLALAFKAVLGNKLRTLFTVAIIAFGIMALIGIITAIEAMSQKLTESFASMGANAFTIRMKTSDVSRGNNRNSDLLLTKKGQKEKKSNLNKAITKNEAKQFVQKFHFPGTTVGVSNFGNRSNIISYKEKKTSPNVTLLGGDENYLPLNSYTLLEGRNFTPNEIGSASKVCIIGSDIAQNLFGNDKAKANGKIISINNLPFLVIGVLQAQGSTFGFSKDNMIITGFEIVTQYFSTANQSYTIAVKSNDLNTINTVMGEAEVLFRGIRKNTVLESSNFTLTKSDSVVEKAMNNILYLRIAAIAIGLITLLGAAIGLMNIMLVAVVERTKEIGLIKAIGGKSKNVRQQLLAEAVIISILGAIVGIILGILLGNVASAIMSTAFVIPWVWILLGISICTLVGILAGLYPAIKAGKLNPIEALRFE